MDFFSFFFDKVCKKTGLDVPTSIIGFNPVASSCSVSVRGGREVGSNKAVFLYVAVFRLCCSAATNYKGCRDSEIL
jgi:hypothetical protein